MKYHLKSEYPFLGIIKISSVLRMSKLLHAFSSTHARNLKPKFKNLFTKKPAPPYKFVLPIGLKR